MLAAISAGMVLQIFSSYQYCSCDGCSYHVNGLPQVRHTLLGKSALLGALVLFAPFLATTYTAALRCLLLMSGANAFSCAGLATQIPLRSEQGTYGPTNSYTWSVSLEHHQIADCQSITFAYMMSYFTSQPATTLALPLLRL